jgi:hypothetical protein
MKQIAFVLSVFLLLSFHTTGQNNVGINDNNSEPNSSAMLDVWSASKGMLVPRVALTGTSSASPVSSPAASLLVFNTATTSDVTPGYYYWNGSQWVRLQASSDPSLVPGMVQKSANATLLKTENLVLASGDITLTLPTVTSVDNGLEITVKNVGTYTDLIVIVPPTGKVIDGSQNSKLTRWRGRTFVASGGNWIVKEKETRAENFLEVSPDASFTTIAEALAFLDEHMAGPSVIRLAGSAFTIESTQSIDLPYPLTIQAVSYGMTTLIAGTGVAGSPMFDCMSETYFKMLIFESPNSGSGNDAIRLSGTDEYYEVKDCVFSGFDKGVVITTSNEAWIFENDYEDIAAAAIEIAAGQGSGGTTRLSETDFFQCKKGVSLLSGAAWVFSVSNCNFYNTEAGTDIGIYYNPANFTNFASIIISNDGWNNQGTFLSGFDFSRTDGRDANAFIDNNHGVESKRPHFNVNVLNNNATTSLTTANAWYKCSWTNTTQYTNSWIINNNKVTYLPVTKRDAIMWISGNVSNSVTNRTLNIGIVKNGVNTLRYGETTVRITVANQPFQFSSIIYLSDVSPGDYFELFISSTSSGDVIKIQDLNWFCNTQ